MYSIFLYLRLLWYFSMLYFVLYKYFFLAFLKYAWTYENLPMSFMNNFEVRVNDYLARRSRLFDCTKAKLNFHYIILQDSVDFDTMLAILWCFQVFCNAGAFTRIKNILRSTISKIISKPLANSVRMTGPVSFNGNVRGNTSHSFQPYLFLNQHKHSILRLEFRAPWTHRMGSVLTHARRTGKGSAVGKQPSLWVASRRCCGNQVVRAARPVVC